MKDFSKVLSEIGKLTTIIETNHPEVYRSLDENPMTILAINHPHLEKEAMLEYLDSLKQPLKHHLETHRKV